MLIRIRNDTPRLAAAWLCVLAIMPAAAQSPADIGQVLERLSRLEEQNRVLLDEVRALRDELAAVRDRAAAPAPPVQEQLEVQQTRIAEQAQSKVEASQHFPIRVTGMALFNTFLNSNGSGGAEYPTFATPVPERSGGATLRQTVLGLDYSGPRTVWGGKVDGSLRVDLFGGSGQTLDQLVRLRTGTIRLSWKNRSILGGVDKPIISPREPNSLAQVGVSPLSGAGNLWLWIPQVRFEQDFRFSQWAGIRAQVGVVQTGEGGGTAAGLYGVMPSTAYVEPARPGFESRLEFFAGNQRRIEIAPALHHSVSHVAYASVPSDVYSVDWLARPWQFLEFTGTAYTGQNVAPLGTGGIRQGFIILNPGDVRAVRSRGGWGQITLHAGPRVWFDLFSGQQDDRNTDLERRAIGKNLVNGANVFFRLAPNVLASFEASQARTSYIGSGVVLNNHYDLALGYLF